MPDDAKGLHAFTFEHAGFRETFLTLTPVEGEDAARLFARHASSLRTIPEAAAVRLDLFGIPGHPDSLPCPVTWLKAGQLDGGPVAGIYTHVLAGAAPRPVRASGRVVGVAYEDAAARYCILGGIYADNVAASRDDQAAWTLAAMESALETVEMRFTDVVRTWFYIDGILEWYDRFNTVRDDFFEQRGVFDGLVPASTGIGARNPAGAALVGALIAVRPKDGAPRSRAVPSPLQCPATDYGSSFSRAVQTDLPGRRCLFVSGTASIDPDGRTAHRGNSRAQIAYTLKVVGAILESRGMTWRDVTRATGYFKRAADGPLLAACAAAEGIPPLPLIAVRNDVCRDNLLFELELDAVKADA